MTTYLLYYLAFINLLLFVLMGVDKAKAKAKRGARRFPEATLFFLAVLGGSIGGIAGMAAFHHKTLHNSFRIGFPAVLTAQLALAAYLVLKSKGMIP